MASRTTARLTPKASPRAFSVGRRSPGFNSPRAMRRCSSPDTSSESRKGRAMRLSSLPVPQGLGTLLGGHGGHEDLLIVVLLSDKFAFW
jgi:hypothetical protein